MQIGAEMRKSKLSGSGVYTEMHSGPECVARRGAALTCSKDETIMQVLSLDQVLTLASSSTFLTAVSGLHTPWSHSLSCWLPLLVDTGAGSCR